MMQPVSRMLIVVLTCAYCLYVLTFTCLCSLQYRALFSWENGDDAVYNQCAYNTSKGRFFFSTVKGDRLLFDHVHPIMALYGLAYLAYPNVHTWFFLTSLLLGLGVIPLFWLARRLFRNQRVALIASLCYLLYSPLHAMNLGALEPEKLAIPFWLFAFEAFYTRALTRFWIFGILAVSCKENMALILCLFGLYATIIRRPLREKVLPVVIGCVWFIAAMTLIMPHLLTTTTYQEEYLKQVEGGTEGFGGIALRLLTHPDEIVLLVLRRDHLRLLYQLLKPTAFLALLAPEVLLIAAPSFGQFLLTGPRLTTPQDHWLSGAIPFVVIASLFGLRRVMRGVERLPQKYTVKTKVLLHLALPAATIAALFGDTRIGELHDDYIDDQRFIAASSIYDPVYFTREESDYRAWTFLELIPPQASVATNYNLLLPLSHRLRLYDYGNPHVKGSDLTADFILLRLEETYYGGGHDTFLTGENLNQLKPLIEAGIYRIVKFEKPFLLLTRKSVAPVKEDLPARVIQAIDEFVIEAERLLPLRGSKNTF